MSLADYQEMFKAILAARGFDKETIPEKFMLLLEEAGEFAKSARKVSGVKVASDPKIQNMNDEAAEVFILLIDLCNSLNIDLAQAVADKEAENSNREWQ